MANDKLFIPNKIKVGYQERSDTYTKMLAYVIYYDLKGKLCKETSWRGWIQGEDVYQKEYVQGKGYVGTEVLVRKALPIDDYENLPTEGFVLNKRAGGYSSGWNHRQMKCRVFDPRGFEFEIGIENLLFILQETNSYKGKGLEGEFVYAWQGADLILLPCGCEDYKSSREFTDLKTMKVPMKELKEGNTYLAKNTNEVIYLGKFEFINWPRWKHEFGVTKEHMFYDTKTQQLLPMKCANLAKTVSTVMASNYADLVEQLQQSGMILPFEIVIESVELPEVTKYSRSYYERGTTQNILKDVFIDNLDGTYTECYIEGGFDSDILFPQPFYGGRNHYNRYDNTVVATEDQRKQKHDLYPAYYHVRTHRNWRITGNELKELKANEQYGDTYYTKYAQGDMYDKKYVTINLKFYNDKLKNLADV